MSPREVLSMAAMGPAVVGEDVETTTARFGVRLIY